MGSRGRSGGIGSSGGGVAGMVSGVKEMTGKEIDDFFGDIVSEWGGGKKDLEEQKKNANGYFPKVLNGVKLNPAEKRILSGYQQQPAQLSVSAQLLKSGELDKFIKSSETWARIPGMMPTYKGELKRVERPFKTLVKKINKNKQDFSGGLFRVEGMSGQTYKKGQKVDIPFASFSENKNIFTKKGGYLSTRMYKPEQGHYAIRIEPGKKKIGGLKVPSPGDLKNQHEVLVSNSFKVKSVKPGQNIGDMKNVTEVVLTPQ